MTTKCWLACLLMWGGATALAAPPPRAQVTADPNDPQKTRPMVSREEREKLGLKPHTWTGVVDPNAYVRLDQMDKVVASLEERLQKSRDVEAFDTLWRIRFKGMVYVQIQVKDKDAQRRVLASLKASECHAPFLFEKVPGLTCYITKDGLDKLAKNADVVGVCLDDKPLLEPGKPISREDLPPAKPGGTVSEQPGVKEGKVDPDVYRAFALGDHVDVNVALHGDSLPSLTTAPSEMRSQLEIRKRATMQLQNRVLATISADEFWVKTRDPFGIGMSGLITKEGLKKLVRHPDVQRIHIQGQLRLPGWRSK